MSDGAWGAILGSVVMIVIAPFAYQNFLQRWERFRKHGDDNGAQL